MLITVIVPVYNVAPYLSRCMESLLGQTYRELEIILVDDGSTDESGKLCDGYAERDGRVQVIHKKNGGLASARNAGMEKATGEYITFADSDDWLDTSAYSLLSEKAEQSGADMIRFGFKRISNGKTLASYVFDQPEGVYEGEELHKMQLDAISFEGVLDYRRYRFLSACMAMFRRSLIEKSGLRFESEREILNEDYLFVMQAIQHAASIYILPKTLYHYDIRSGSLTTAKRPRLLERKQKLCARYREVLPDGDAEIDSRIRNFYIDGIYASLINEVNDPQPKAEAVKKMKKILADEELARCLKLNRHLINTPKAKLICFFMRRGMASAFYSCYRAGSKEK